MCNVCKERERRGERGGVRERERQRERERGGVRERGISSFRVRVCKASISVVKAARAGLILRVVTDIQTEQSALSTLQM